MNALSRLQSISLCCIGTALSLIFVEAQDAPPSARDLAAQLSTNVKDGSSLVRLKMEIRQPASGTKNVLQLQVKARRTKPSTDILYQVLWPKERKGESVLLQKSAGRAPTGKVFVPPSTVQNLSSSQMKESILGSDLSYEDIIEDFYGWENQSIAGTEVVDRVNCQILESKPGKGDRSSYSRVRSWIDVRRMVPLRIEKYSNSGQLVRRIETTRVAKDDTDRLVPASLTVQRAGQDSVTELEGSNSRHDVTLTDQDFTPEGIQSLSGPGSAPK